MNELCTTINWIHFHGKNSSGLGVNYIKCTHEYGRALAFIFSCACANLQDSTVPVADTRWR